jgi:GMP synthase-like glutamine amidotransferase
MQPVLILQHLNTDGPAYLQTWLQAQGLAHEVFNTQAGQDFPVSLGGYGALAILGGEMSANDDLPSLRRAEALFLQAVQTGVPTLGHCLGGQLMARALGAAVTASPAPEIGWQALQVHSAPEGQAWFGPAGEQHVYHWHSETFGLPPGAVWQTAQSPAAAI